MTIHMRASLPLVLGVVVALAGCRPSAPAASESTEEASEAGAEESPAQGSSSESRDLSSPEARAKIWAAFVAAFNGRDSAQLQAYTEADGLLLLDNPGAFVRVRKLDGVMALLELEGTYDGARIKEIQLRAAIDAGQAPTINCEEDEAPEGMFLSDSDGQQVLERVEALDKYELASKDEVEALRPLATRVAQETAFVAVDASHSFRFFFALVDGQPKLLAVDAVVPCSA